MENINFETIPTNGISLHTAIAGPKDGTPIFLLHGFPEAWFGWEAQIQPLMDAGFRVIVPDQRGYNLSDKPAGTSSYKISVLADDILGLADFLGYQQFHLAGHDFGAMVSWHLAIHHPQRVKRLAIANVPHPDVMSAYLRTHPAQMLKSWYAFFFQLPKLPEAAVRAGNWQFLISAMPETLSPEQKARYRAAWAQPGAITAMINWYRASFRGTRQNKEPVRIGTPTLILWGKQDPHLSHQMASLSLNLCEQGQLIFFEDATHWVLQDKPLETSQLLVEHFSKQEEP